MWNAFSTALSFLTIIQLPCDSKRPLAPENLAASFSFFPLIGLFLGGCSTAPALILAPHTPTPLLSSIIVAVMVILTRAFHLDGLADLADGVGGGYTRERRLEIMKDSRIGAFGAIALTLSLIMKICAVDALLGAQVLWPLALAPALSRYAMVLAAYRNTYARSEGGLAKPFLEHITARDLLIASGTAVAAAAALAPLTAGLLEVAATLALVAFMRHLASRWLGGVTGDVLGAVNEICELTLLVVAAIIIGR